MGRVRTIACRTAAAYLQQIGGPAQSAVRCAHDTSKACSRKLQVPLRSKKLELLFEIGCEEIPAGMLPRAEEELKVNLEKLLDRRKPDRRASPSKPSAVRDA